MFWCLCATSLWCNCKLPIPSPNSQHWAKLQLLKENDCQTVLYLNGIHLDNWEINYSNFLKMMDTKDDPLSTTTWSQSLYRQVNFCCRKLQYQHFSRPLINWRLHNGKGLSNSKSFLNDVLLSEFMWSINDIQDFSHVRCIIHFNDILCHFHYKQTNLIQF